MSLDSDPHVKSHTVEILVPLFPQDVLWRSYPKMSQEYLLILFYIISGHICLKVTRLFYIHLMQIAKGTS